MTHRTGVALVVVTAGAMAFGWMIFRAASPPAPYRFIPDIAPKVTSNFRGFHIWVYQFPGRFDDVVARAQRELGTSGMTPRSSGARVHTFSPNVDDITVFSGKVDLVKQDTHGTGVAGFDPDPNWVTVEIRSAAEPPSLWQRLRFALPFLPGRALRARWRGLCMTVFR